jgi:hypothetical protein
MGLYPRSISEYISLIGIPRGKNSQVYIVDPDNGNDDRNTGLSFNSPLLTIPAAYAKCVANQHDVVLVLAGAAGLNLSATLTWGKNHTHLIGMCAPSHVAQRARIFQLSTATGLSPLINVTASGCIIRDLYTFQGVDDATSLINVQVAGSRNYFKNVHFAGGGHASQAIDGGCSLKINGGSENLFENCVIGVDTIDAGNGMCGLSFAATGGAARNKFKDSHFSMQAGHAGAIFIEVLGNAGIDRYQVFENCIFSNLSATAMTEAINVAAGFDANNKRLLMKDCALIGATDWEANDRGAVYLNNGTITAGGNSGLMAASNTV